MSSSQSPRSIQEEDILQDNAHEQYFSTVDHHALFTKGKGKERQSQREYTDSGSDEAAESSRIAAYPPTNDEVVESRRVEETLRAWDIAERQRRKAARESTQQTNTPPSLVSDISRRASLLWPGKKSKHPSISIPDGLGNHRVLEPIDTLPLTDANLSPAPSISELNDTPTENPFAGPPESLSPFSDSHKAKRPDIDPSIPVNHLASSFSMGPPSRLLPPKPLDLPPPRTPPPPTSSPPPSTPPPNTVVGASGHEVQVQDYRWWHDWLCGCGEGADRGGDFQAGRTNPFE